MDVPANSAIIAVNCALWFYCWNARVEVSKISFNYDRVMTHGEFWRLITSVFSHLDFMHILFNMSSLAGVASVEVSIGWLAYLKITFLLIVLSSALMMLASYVLIEQLGRSHERNVHCVGYSGILFGWLVLQAWLAPAGTTVRMFGLLSMPAWASPLAALLITHLIVPNASWTGHVSGIVAGIFISIGAFTWFSDILFYISLFWATVFILVSVKRTIPGSFSFISIDSSSPSTDTNSRGSRGAPLGAAQQERPRLVNGVIVRGDTPTNQRSAHSTIEISALSNSQHAAAPNPLGASSKSSDKSTELDAADPGLPKAEDDGYGVGFTYR